MRALLLLFSIIVASQAKETYKNLYGRRGFSNGLVNMFGATAGAAQFAQEGEKFMFSEPPDRTPTNNEEFDFIVVGAGTAGATIASRLTEIPDVRVLLIEAGRSENLLMDIPILAHYLQFSDEINWKYKTEPSNSYCKAMVDTQCNWPRGKVMGGSSVLNYMIATRGFPKDYDRWEALGNKGWSWRDVLPYFKKLETINIPEYKSNTRLHNNDGPVSIEHPAFHTPLASAFLRAGVELGYKIIDYNSGEEPVGFSYLQTTTKNGTRMSSNVAYLHPASSRRNLIVTKNTMVRKVLFADSGKRAIGVEYVKGNRRYRVTATKEVILSAGAIGSPQILMLSGVGPAEHLREMRIKPIVDLPVGENLMDHIAYGGLIFEIDQPVAYRLNDLVNPANPYMKDFFLERKGPLTAPGACEAIAFIDVDRPNNHTAYPNIELLFVGSSFVTVSAVRYDFGIDERIWNETYASLENSYSWTVFPLLLRPKSRGRVLLRSADINSKPRIIANYMSDKEDVRILIKGIRETVKISRTKAMQRFGTRLSTVKLKACEGFEENSDDYWECATRSMTINIYHYSGTCKMGPRGDPTAVVDERLRVHGIKALRVADASIMPEIMSGHTNIPSFMIGEKLSDMVKEDWGYPIHKDP
ncbi:glucose dehydrogenase [FAD, quinone] [Diachasma alloeum]|uniref:glucose dehydrogenase [FAD, quinone] n=1 Tax=Diachasma alloeum TaxID=454923 RepID=UPI0010FB13CC|nr:glucose dehydrogenase [FAD, quinone] [Diachasma alloeum]